MNSVQQRGGEQPPTRRLRPLRASAISAVGLLLVGGCTAVPDAARASSEVAVGRHLFDTGQVADAQRFFEAVSAQHPDDPTAAFYLGRIAFGAGQPDQAVPWLEKAVQLDERNSEYHCWLGRAYGQQARRAQGGQQFFLARKVRRHLERAVALNPDNLAARLDLVEYYLQAPGLLGGSYAKARLQADEITKRDVQQGLQARRLCEQAEGRARPAGPGGGQEGGAGPPH